MSQNEMTQNGTSYLKDEKNMRIIHKKWVFDLLDEVDTLEFVNYMCLMCRVVKLDFLDYNLLLNLRINMQTSIIIYC